MKGTIQESSCVERFGNIILNELKDSNISACVCGGAVRDYYMGKPIKTDIDLFFESEGEYNKADKYFTEANAQILWESDNGKKYKYNKYTFDLVKKTYGSAPKLILKFDFTVSMLAVDLDGVYYGDTTFIDLSKRQLIINELPFPLSTMKRAFRYYTKGFLMCVGEMQKLAEAIQNTPKIKEKTKKEDNQNEEETPPSGENNFFSGID